MLSHQQGPKLPVVLGAPAHPRHQGADGARGSRTSEPPRCRNCSRLPQIRATKKIEQVPGVTSKGLRCAMFPEGGGTARFGRDKRTRGNGSVIGKDESKRQRAKLSGSWQQGHSAAYNTRHVIKSSAKDSTRRSVGITL
ncbi:hypothetical protein GOBAR_DD19265 [Gossypium barbadense]|nr:hypothetical protein GOBAR_DD19265 [Gossypium barbadense]